MSHPISEEERTDLLRALAVGDGQNLDGFDLGHTAEIMYGHQANAVLRAGWRRPVVAVGVDDPEVIERAANAIHEVLGAACPDIADEPGCFDAAAAVLAVLGEDH